MVSFDLTHARHDSAHCLAPGLFRSLKRGERKKLKLDTTYQLNPTSSIRFVGFEPLDAQDMRLLQGIVALSGPNGLILKDTTTHEHGEQLRLLLDAQLDAARSDALVVQGTLQQLMREIGYSTDGEQTRKDLKASLLRMSNVTIQVKQGSREASYHLLSYIFDESDGSVYVALNPRIAAAVIGSGGHTRIDMNEVRSLSSDPARLIHQRLSGWLSPGSSGRISLERICEYVWPDECNTEAMKKRKQKAKAALQELSDLKWGIDEYARGKYSITRPAVPF